MSLWKSCCCCTDGGKFVYASHSFVGYVDPKWWTVPTIQTVLYRIMTGVFERDLYYVDVDDGLWHYWMTVTQTVQIEYHETCPGVIKHIIVTGSESGVVYEKTYDESDGSYDEFIMGNGDYAILNDPNGDPNQPDHFPVNVGGGGVGGGTVVESVVSATTGEVVCHWITTTSTPETTDEWTATITGSEPYNPATITAFVAAMLYTVPLDNTNSPNLTTLVYGTPECELEATTDSITTSDDDCTDDEDREQTWTPAAMRTELPTNLSASPPEGVVRSGTQVTVQPYYYESGIFFPIANVIFPQNDTALAYGKKGLLTRTTTDDWTVLLPYDPVTETDGDPECLGADTTKCRRYYYPEGADDGGGPSAENFTFSGDGTIYREIPVIIGPPGDCPDGILPFDNPCDP